MTPTPSNACLICHRTLEEAGGKRVVADRRFGLTLLDAEEKPTRGTTYPLANGLVLRIWGKRWDEDLVSRALEEAESGHSWFCQSCMGRVCSVCRWPVIWPPGTNVLYEDGSTPHQMPIPAVNQCTNPECEHYLPRNT